MTALRVNIQKRGGECYEIPIQTSRNEESVNQDLLKLMQTIKSSEQSAVILDSNTNPYQIYFGIFNENVFGSDLQYNELQVDLLGTNYSFNI